MSIEVPYDVVRRYVKVNGEEDFNLEWLFVDQDDVKLLALRMKNPLGNGDVSILRIRGSPKVIPGTHMLGLPALMRR